jgi:hypothetical protein
VNNNRDVTAHASAATARAGAPQPRIQVKAGTVAATAHASAPAPTVIAGLATGIALVAAGHRLMTQQPAGPEPGYHLAHEHGDVLGAVAFGFGMAALGVSLWTYARTFKL